MILPLVIFPLVPSLLSSCQKKEAIELPQKSKIISVLDTLTSMNYLFDIEKIHLDFSEHGVYLSDIIAYSADLKGNIIISDREGTIFLLDENGSYINSMNKMGRGPGEYSLVIKLCLTESGEIILFDHQQGELELYDSTLVHKKTTKVENVVPPVRMKSSGNRLFMSFIYLFEHAVYKYDLKTGELLDSYGEIDELMEKYKTRAYSGGLLVEGDEVYYMLPDYYQIYR
ncbi:MAG: 6-bladed beta-propeller, partial [Melioribacteraceae bacterium]|nr:6-bladed beta-propeller [Melioribacteraceae bacterium]MCF8262993.1 6-bladed beta-propeller [Melioribacteraceae bacterium]MCF8430438.1 6-bladed beta-propeller [Melioribacteraceae bacterium]